jgi:SPP1 family holin
MNAHITTPRTVSAATLARTAVLGLALANQLLSAAGKPLLPIDNAQLEQMISTGFTVGAALAAWWKNNSFTSEAIEADAFMARMKKSVH